MLVVGYLLEQKWVKKPKDNEKTTYSEKREKRECIYLSTKNTRSQKSIKKPNK